MQDRICQIDENLLQRTAGPYMWVKSGKAQPEQMSSASPLEADVPGDHLRATSLRTGRHRGLAAPFGQHSPGPHKAGVEGDRWGR